MDDWRSIVKHFDYDRGRLVLSIINTLPACLEGCSRSLYVTAGQNVYRYDKINQMMSWSDFHSNKIYLYFVSLQLMKQSRLHGRVPDVNIKTHFFAWLIFKGS